MPAGQSVTYAIDPLGRRTGKFINGALQWQLLWLDTLRPLAQIKPDGSLDAVFLYGDRPNVPELMVRAGVTYRLLTDHLGSVRLVLRTDTTTPQDLVAQRIDYDPWGRVTFDSNPGFQPFGYAGGLYDPDTGLTRFGARDYDGETGRWTSKDPIGFAGGDSSLYGYVGGDPISKVDPTGRFAIIIPFIPTIITGTDIAIGAGLGAIGYGLDLIFNRPKNPPDIGPPGGFIQGPRRGRDYCPDGTPQTDYDRPHQGAEYPHIHDWVNGSRDDHQGRPYSPWPAGNIPADGPYSPLPR